MKRLPNLLMILLLGFSCTQNESVMEPQDDGLTPQEKIILLYLQSHMPSSRFNESGYELEPYVVNGDTLMYLVNFEEGWTLFSNDFRMPMILMKSDEGNLDFDNINSGILENLVSTAACILSDSISLGDGDWPRIPHPNPSTQFQMITSTTTDNYGPLVTTNWHQDYPYNMYTPCDLDSFQLHGTLVHKKLGYGAVAVGQLVNYWHNRFGTPQYTVTSVSAPSYPGNHYMVSGWGSSTFDNINNGNTSAAALLMTYVGNDMGTNYGMTKSTAYLSNLLAVIENQCGVSLHNQAISASCIKSWIAQDKPVLLFAFDGNTTRVKSMIILDNILTVKTRYRTSLRPDGYYEDSVKYFTANLCEDRDSRSIYINYDLINISDSLGSNFTNLRMLGY